MEPATAAGLIAAEQAVSTTLEVGVPAAYALSRPTLPLRATLTPITSPSFLPRTHHSCVVIGNHAYLYGGEDENGRLAEGDVHVVTLPLPIGKGRRGDGDVDYKCVPPLGEEGVEAVGKGDGFLRKGDEEGPVPGGRTWHTACSIGGRMFVYGGRTGGERVVEEGVKGRVWVFDTESLRWSWLDPSDAGEEYDVPEARTGHAAAACEWPLAVEEGGGLGERIKSGVSNMGAMITGRSKEMSSEPHGTLFIYGGVGVTGKALNDAWAFDVASRRWTRLPDPPVKDGPDVAAGTLAVCDSRLFLVSHPLDKDGSCMGGEMLCLQLAFPIHEHFGSSKGIESTTPKAPQAQISDKSPALHVAETLEQLKEGERQLQSDQSTWEKHSFPANPLTPGPSARQGSSLLPISLSSGRHYLLYTLGAGISTIHAYQPPTTTASTAAGLKDLTRSKLGADSAAGTWGEVVVEAGEEYEGVAVAGKAHPGPRGWFAAAALEEGGVGVVVFGGEDGAGGVRGDGWVVGIQGP